MEPAPAALNGSAPLPAPLRELCARERMAVARVEEVTRLECRGGARRTFRVELADGGLVKARTHPRTEVAARMARWLPLLAPRGFAALRAAEGAATLEEWVPGSAAPAEDASTAESAGALLGGCHTVVPPGRLAADDARLARWAKDALRWVDEIRAAGHLPNAARVRAALRDARPRAATWGVYHGDFAPENLVVDARGLRCVDNTTVGLHLLEVDAGFTFNRWPLSGALREAFLRGYRRRADPEPFLGCEPFWRISAALRSAAYRIREGTGGVDLPLAEVDRLVA